MIKLYHGTDEQGYNGIQETGIINGPVYLTADETAAELYAGRGGEVIEVIVDESILLVDFDLPGGRLMDVESANNYNDSVGWAIIDFINAGHCVGTPNNITIN